MKRILIACTVMALAACSGKDENGDGIADGVVSPSSVSQVAPSTPVGTVSGQVLKLDKSPLDGVKVTLLTGDKALTANTNGSGAYSFTNVPAGGNASLTFEKAGYVTARSQGTIPATAGNFPINNGNLNGGQIALAALTSTVRFRVITTEGAPATGATATLEFSAGAYQFGGGSSVNGLYTAKASVGADGLLVFSNVPELEHQATFNTWYTNNYLGLAISPLDTTGDGVPDWRGSYQYWTMSSYIASETVPLITLPRGIGATSLSVEGSNLGSFDNSNMTPFANALSNSEPISITFNQPINETGTARWVKVVAEDCKTDVPVSVTQVSPWTLQISANGGWTLGAKYNVAVHVTGLESGDSQTFIGYGFGLDATQPKPVSSVTLVAEKPAMATATNLDLPVYADPTPTAQKVWAIFDTPMRNTGGGQAVVQFNFDINTNAGNLESCGETGNKFRQGYNIVASEPTSAYDNKALPVNTFACKASGYTTRWLIELSSFNGCTAPTTALMPSTTTSKVLFPDTTSSTSTYQSITGASVVGELNAGPISISVQVAP